MRLLELERLHELLAALRARLSKVVDREKKFHAEAVVLAVAGRSISRCGRADAVRNARVVRGRLVLCLVGLSVAEVKRLELSGRFLLS